MTVLSASMETLVLRTQMFKSLIGYALMTIIDGVKIISSSSAGVGTGADAQSVVGVVMMIDSMRVTHTVVMMMMDMVRCRL